MRTKNLKPSSSLAVRALVASLVLHALLVTSLVLMHADRGPERLDARRVVPVEIVRVGRGTTPGGASRDADLGQSAGTEPKVAAAIGPTPGPAAAIDRPGPAATDEAPAEPAREIGDEVAAPERATAERDGPAAAPDAAEIAPAPPPGVLVATAADAPRPADDPAEAGADQTEPPPDPEPSAAMTEPEPSAASPESESERGTAPETPASSAATAVTVTVTVAAAEQRMLDRRLAGLVAKLAADADGPVTAEWKHGGQTYEATLTPVPAVGSMGIDAIVAAVSTVQDGTRFSTELRMQRLAFSSFAQFVDRWDPNVGVHDDEIDGRFHSNSEIRVDGTRGVRPLFHGKVTTAEGIDTTNAMFSSRDEDVFRGGVETDVPKIYLPRSFVQFPGEGAAESDAHELDRDARVRFHADGSYEWRYLDTPAPAERVVLGMEPHYIVGTGEIAIHVSGTVNGKVVVYSPERIVIEGDLVYEAHPALLPDSDDYLGLVSDGTVEIAEPAATGGGDLTVHAAIYAKGRFSVPRYSRSERATLAVYGSIAAGSISATEPRYRTELRFDPRLANVRPPSFPMTERYEITTPADAWTWELAE